MQYRLSMNIQKLRLIYFSPTQTTKKVLDGIALGFGCDDIEKIDLTISNTGHFENKVINDGLTIIGVPVYSGRIPPDAATRIRQFSAEGTPPAVLVVLYGNREFEDALKELNDLMIQNGFKPIAGAAFIGEHSFANKEYPIALNRPDAEDINRCLVFGSLLKEKIEHSDSVEGLSVPVFPGNYPYKEFNILRNICPETLEDKCSMCGICTEVCPTMAISLKDKVFTKNEACILCCACVKNCSSEARVIMNNLKIKDATKWLWENCNKRKEPEFFI